MHGLDIVLELLPEINPHHLEKETELHNEIEVPFTHLNYMSVSHSTLGLYKSKSKQKWVRTMMVLALKSSIGIVVINKFLNWQFSLSLAVRAALFHTWRSLYSHQLQRQLSRRT